MPSVSKALFDEYFDRLYLYARRFLRDDQAAADCVHDVFLRLRHSRAVEGDLRSYLYDSTRNACLDRLRYLWVVPAAQPSEDTVSLQEREDSAAVQKAIDALHPLEREALRLRWSEHLTVNEAATQMGISPELYTAHLQRARDQLGQTLAPILAREL